MIEAKELRIGNYLKNDGVIVKIDARSIFDIWDDKGLKNYEPIAITEEWLFKFGFGINKKTCVHIFDLEIDDKLFFSVFINNDQTEGLLIKNSTRSSKIIFTRPIYYIHQLQNLFFALTQKELELIS